MTASTGISRAAGEFLEELAAVGAARKTVEARRLGLERFVRHCDREGLRHPRDITPAFLEQYALSLRLTGLSDAAAEQYLRAPRLLLARLAERGVIFESPARHIPIHRKSGRLPRVPGEDQVRRLLARPSPRTPVGLRDRALMEFLYTTGARIAEALALDVDGLDTEGGTVRLFGKGRRERVCPVGRICRAALARYLREARPELLGGRDCAALWIGIRGERMTVGNAELRMRIYCRAAGIRPPVTPHGLRRAMATHMLRNGADPITLQTVLGHASLKHLSHYLRLSADDLRRMHRRSRPGE